MDSTLDICARRLLDLLDDDGVVVCTALFSDELRDVADAVATRWHGSVRRFDHWESASVSDDAPSALRIADVDTAGTPPDPEDLFERVENNPLLVLETTADRWPAHMCVGLPAQGPIRCRQLGDEPVARYLEGHWRLVAAGEQHRQLSSLQTLESTGSAILGMLGWEGRSAEERMAEAHRRLSAIQQNLLALLCLADGPLSSRVASSVLNEKTADIVEASLALDALSWIGVSGASDASPALMEASRLGRFFLTESEETRRRSIEAIAPKLTAFFEGADTVESAGRGPDTDLQTLGTLARWAIDDPRTPAKLADEAQNWLWSAVRLHLWARSDMADTPTDIPPPHSHLIGRIAGSDADGGEPLDAATATTSRDLMASSRLALFNLGCIERAEHFLAGGDLSSAQKMLGQLDSDIFDPADTRLRARIAIGACYVSAMLGEFRSASHYLDLLDSPTQLPPQWAFEAMLLGTSLELVGCAVEFDTGFDALLECARRTEDPVHTDVAMTLLEIETSGESTDDIDLGQIGARYPEVASFAAVLRVHDGGADAVACSERLDALCRHFEDVWEWRIQLEFASRLLGALESPTERSQLQRWLTAQNVLRWHGETTATEEIALPPLSRRLWNRCADDHWLYERDADTDDLFHLTAHPHGYWFRVEDGELVDLSSRTALRRIFRQFLEQHRNDDTSASDVHQLTEIGWPDQVLDHDSAKARVYTAIRQLRNMGLDDALVTRHDGYALSNKVVLHLRQLTARSARIESIPGQ